MEATTVSDTATHQLTLRIPTATHQQLKRAAERRGSSLNRFALAALQEELARAEYEELKAAYDLVADDDDIVAEDYFHIAKEAIGDDE
jgi:uncharacterized protein (DUF1778 family)